MVVFLCFHACLASELLIGLFLHVLIFTEKNLLLVVVRGCLIMANTYEPDSEVHCRFLKVQMYNKA